MNERVKLLKDHLPKFLVENNETYSILSKGLHELSEENCLEYFLTMKDSIRLILDEIIEKNEKVNLENVVSKEIKRISSSLI